MNQAARLAPALRGLRAVTIPASSFRFAPVRCPATPPAAALCGKSAARTRRSWNIRAGSRALTRSRGPPYSSPAGTPLRPSAPARPQPPPSRRVGPALVSALADVPLRRRPRLRSLRSLRRGRMAPRCAITAGSPRGIGATGDEPPAERGHRCAPLADSFRSAGPPARTAWLRSSSGRLPLRRADRSGVCALR